MGATEFTLLAGKPTIDKDPNATLDYTVDFTAWLDAMTDTLISHTAYASGVVVDSSTIVASKKVVLWVSGGTVSPTGESASVTVRVTTAGGRTDDRTVYFKIKEA